MAENIYEIEGDKLLKSGNEYDAIDSYTKAIEQDTTNINLYFKRAVCYIRTQGDCPKEEYKKILQLAPQSPEGYYLRALDIVHEYSQENNQEKALSYANKAIELNPNFANAYALRAICKIEMDDYTSALADNDKVIELISDDYYYYYLRAKTKFELKDYAGAIEDYTKALNINPNHIESYQGRGKSKKKIGDNLGSKQDFKIADDIIKTMPDDDSDADGNLLKFPTYKVIYAICIYFLLFIPLVMIGKFLPENIQEPFMNLLTILFAICIIVLIILAMIKLFIRYSQKIKNLISKNKNSKEK